ncbi:MAG: hypothetical protein KC431_07295 [Myxococcales bacterium]|nr:hypothetical protein [Myxococcales bacterium]MCA9697313.1 hypothetical protein [Myxococcales bacterium]
MSPVTVLGGVVRRKHPSSPSTASSCSGPPPDRSAAADAPAPKSEAPADDDDLHFDRRETKGKHFVRRVCTSTPKPDAGGRPGHRRRKRGR